MTNAWQVVMDPDRNPLRRLPRIVAFQLMSVLAWMWSSVFCLWIGAVWLIGPSILAHTILLVGVFFTAVVFAQAERRARSYDETFKDPLDGGALYDDVWGAPDVVRPSPN